jgi:hypothetical protein
MEEGDNPIGNGTENQIEGEGESPTNQSHEE